MNRVIALSLFIITASSQAFAQQPRGLRREEVFGPQQSSSNGTPPGQLSNAFKEPDGPMDFDVAANTPLYAAVDAAIAKHNALHRSGHPKMRLLAGSARPTQLVGPLQFRQWPLHIILEQLLSPVGYQYHLNDAEGWVFVQRMGDVNASLLATAAPRPALAPAPSAKQRVLPTHDQGCGPDISWIECQSWAEMARRQTQMSAEAARTDLGCGPDISWIECQSWIEGARRQMGYSYGGPLGNYGSPYGWTGAWGYAYWLCTQGVPQRLWPAQCMGALKFDSRLRKWSAKDIMVRIDGTNKGSVAAHDNRYDEPIMVPPGMHHIIFVAKDSNLPLFEDDIDVPSLIQSGYDAFRLPVSDNDFAHSPFVGSVEQQHRRIKASELLKRP